MVKLSNDIFKDSDIPYFMWDYQLTNKQIREILNSPDENRKIWLTSKIMRDAKFKDIWKLIDLKFILKNKEKFNHRLGRQQKLWDFLFSKYEEYGYTG